MPASDPSTNFWEQPQNRSQQNNPNFLPQHSEGQSGAPLTTYNDCLKMTTNYKQWYQALLILQSLMGLKKFELPDSLRKNIIVEPNNNTESIFLDPSNNTLQNQSNPNLIDPNLKLSPSTFPKNQNPKLIQPRPLINPLIMANH